MSLFDFSSLRSGSHHETFYVPRDHRVARFGGWAQRADGVAGACRGGAGAPRPGRGVTGRGRAG